MAFSDTSSLASSSTALEEHVGVTRSLVFLCHEIIVKLLVLSPRRERWYPTWMLSAFCHHFVSSTFLDLEDQRFTVHAESRPPNFFFFSHKRALDTTTVTTPGTLVPRYVQRSSDFENLGLLT